MRLRIRELLDELNANLPRAQRIRIEDVAAAVGVPRGTLSRLTTFTSKPVTNTATLEALYRYFSSRFCDARGDRGFRWEELVEIDPPAGGSIVVRVDDLYPERAARRQRRRDQ